jgi:hypothetical protein
LWQAAHGGPSLPLDFTSGFSHPIMAHYMLQYAPEGDVPMEMLLMGLCVSVFGLAVAALAFGAATRPETAVEAAQPALQPAKSLAAPRFFAHQGIPAIPMQPRVPIEALLLQIENHVRLEQAAAESFVEFPTSALLHSKTVSPLVN